MHKWILAILFVASFSISSHATELATAVSAAAKRASVGQTSAEVSSKRFSLLRYFPVDTTIYKGDFPKTDSARTHALATYLYNMHMSQQAYGPLKLSDLTLNFLGAADPFYYVSFDIKQAEEFYKHHKKDIQKRLRELYQKDSRGTYHPNETIELEFLHLLEKAPIYQGHPGYYNPQINRISTAFSSETIARLSLPWQEAQKQAAQSVILFERPQIPVDAYDSPLMHSGTHISRTYRWAKDECYYNSYILGKEITKAITADRSSWRHTRVYLITARPKTGYYLQPAIGKRFAMANGQQASPWQYHTALLVVLNPAAGVYVPIVIDSFLGRSNYLSVDDWLHYFHTKTVFFAQPFHLVGTVEKALVKPNGIKGNNIIYQGKTYTPAPIEK